MKDDIEFDVDDIEIDENNGNKSLFLTTAEGHIKISVPYYATSTGCCSVPMYIKSYME